MIKRFIKSQEGAEKAQKAGFNPVPGTKIYWQESEDGSLQSFAEVPGWIIETSFSGNQLKKAGLFTSNIEVTI